MTRAVVAAAAQQIVPVLAGGGGRLSAHIGVLQAIEDIGLTYETLVGVSGGSIVGALVAAGHSLAAVREIAQDTDFSRFTSSNIFTLLRTGGFSTGTIFRDWMDDLLEGRCFSDMPLDFRVIATDVRSGLPVVFDRQETPDAPVSQAVRFSMSVPVMFCAQMFGDQILVDGSILSEDALRRDWRGDSTPVVVFKLRSRGNGELLKKSRLPVYNHLTMLMHTFMTTMSREYVNEDFWLSTIVIDAGYTSPINLKLSAEEKRRLYEAGYATTSEILPKKMARQRDV